MKAQDLLKEVNTDIVIEIMDELGSPVYKRGVTSDGQEFLTFKTICHGGDSSKLYYYTDSKTFYCYTNCGSMSLFDLVMKVKHYSDKEFYLAMAYVARKVGINLGADRDSIGETYSKDILEDMNTMERLKALKDRSYGSQEIEKFYDPHILNYFDGDAFYQGWIDEGIDIKSMKKYNIRFYFLEGHIIIPHYNIDGKLVGIRRRSLNPDDSKNKYMPVFLEGRDYGHPLGLNFYGIDKNYKAIQKQHKVVLVEGEKSVLLSDSYYGDKSVALATCGFNVSDWQIKMLKKLGVDTVYLAFDKDFDVTKDADYRLDPVTWEAYQHYKKRLRTLSQRLAPDFITYEVLDRDNKLQLKDSPLDRNKENFELLMSRARLIEGLV